MSRLSMDRHDPARFWSHVDIGEAQACWLWTAYVHPIGYGVYSHATRAHRLAWYLTHGPIPPGMWVLHRCDNKRCCNPAHLFLGTRQDNIDDAVRKQRMCWGERRANAKLTEAQAREIQKLYSSGQLKQRQIARRFGIHQCNVSRIINGKRWPHL